jgi:hypothetical protein
MKRHGLSFAQTVQLRFNSLFEFSHRSLIPAHRDGSERRTGY